MAQTVPIDAYLGANRTGLAIGATLYQLDGSTSHAAFSTSGWYEAPASSGAWHHAGLSLPDAGGVIAVGVSGTEYMRVAVEAAKPLASDYTVARAAKLDNLDVTISSRAATNNIPTTSDIKQAVWANESRTLTSHTGNITIISAVNGNTINVYANDTWKFSINSSSLNLSNYENVAFICKYGSNNDNEALLYVRNDLGLIRIGGNTPTSSSLGSLIIDNQSQISLMVSIQVTDVSEGKYTWWIKGFDTTPATDEGYTLATGKFNVLKAGLLAKS